MLPDITFTNNVGFITLKRCMLEVSDEWTWDGRNATHAKQIAVEAWINRDSAEGLEGVVTRTNGAPNHGGRGQLVLPWATLENVKIESIEQGEGVWAEMIPVSVRFIDDHPDTNIYSMFFFGLELHNPRLSIPVPSKNTTDNYAQTPMRGGASMIVYGDVAPKNPWYGPIRYRSGYAMMSLSLSGTLFLPDGVITTHMIETLQQRIGVGTVTGSMPVGYPATFALGEAIPGLSSELGITHVIVAGARLNWSVEQRSARVNINLLAQPQAWA